MDHPTSPRARAPAGSHRPDPPYTLSEQRNTRLDTAPSASTKPAAVPATNRGWCNRIAMVQTSSLGPTHSDSLVASVQTSTFIRIGEPQCPALHNRRFRPSWFTQPPRWRACQQSPFPSRAINEALPPASSACCRDGRRRWLRCAYGRWCGPRALRSPLGRLLCCGETVCCHAPQWARRLRA